MPEVKGESVQITISEGTFERLNRIHEASPDLTFDDIVMALLDYRAYRSG